MQVVIDIKEDDYKVFERQIVGNTTPRDRLFNAIKNGTPLPKGHGDLIDRSKIEWYGCNFESDKNCNKVNKNCSICFFAECSHDQVMELSAVIPAESEDKE